MASLKDILATLFNTGGLPCCNMTIETLPEAELTAKDDLAVWPVPETGDGPAVGSPDPAAKTSR